MNSMEAVDHMVEAIEQAEIAAGDLPSGQRAEVYVKIAERWEQVVWQLADAEEKIARAAEKAAGAKKSGH